MGPRSGFWGTVRVLPVVAPEPVDVRESPVRGIADFVCRTVVILVKVVLGDDDAECVEDAEGVALTGLGEVDAGLCGDLLAP